MSEIKNVPEQTAINTAVPKTNKNVVKSPKEFASTMEVPEENKTVVEIPEENKTEIPVPDDIVKENAIFFKNKWIEIKPTKLKYFRNRTAAIYSVLKIVPLNEFLAYNKGTFDKERDSDQILFDFLCAVFDDSAFVKKNYNDMTAEDVDHVLKIFGRINHIDDKEEEAKNRAAQMKH